MRKVLIMLSLISFPLIVCAQTTEKQKVLIEQYQPADQQLIELGEKHFKEMNQDIDKQLKNMTPKQKAAMTDSLRYMERKKARISGDNSAEIEVNGNGEDAIRKYFNKFSSPDLYIPLTEPEIVEVDVDSLK